MTDLHDKRVEAAAEAMDKNFNPDKYPVMAAMFRDYAAVGIAAADAVVTEEMIAETILKALVFTNENSKPWADGLARDIAALFRGGVK